MGKSAVLSVVFLFVLATDLASTPRGVPPEKPLQGFGNADTPSVLGMTAGSPATAVRGGSAAVLRLPHSRFGFELNRGQFADPVRYGLRQPEYALYVTASEVIFHPAGKGIARVRFQDANPDPAVEAMDELPGRVNYFTGRDRSNWRTGITQYSRVVLRDLYPGVDFVLYGTEGELECDFVVVPGASPDNIRLVFEGADCLELDQEGHLRTSLAGVDLLVRRPVAYQQVRGARQPVGCAYVLLDSETAGFQLNSYDAGNDLVIDPVLRFSTFLGGNKDDTALAVAVAPDGDVVVAGATLGNFPLQDPLQASNNGQNDVFVTRMKTDGSALIFSTYLGGSWFDDAEGVAVDGAGDIYIAGATTSIDFPTVNAVQADPPGNGDGDAFVAKISADGSTLIYSTYLGGHGYDAALGIAVDQFGATYVTGHTESDDFPLVNPAQGVKKGRDAFVTRLNPSGTAFSFSSYLGGSGDDISYGLHIDSEGDVFVVGYTASADFPTVNPLQAALAGGDWDAFVTKIDPSAGNILYSTYLGGSSKDYGAAVALDSRGAIYVAGGTNSSDFPIKNAFQPVCRGEVDVFVTKLDPDGSDMVFSTFLGGWSNDDLSPGTLAVDQGGFVYLAGRTESSDFPVRDAVQGTIGGYSDAFVAKVMPDGSGLSYSTFLGGQHWDHANAVAVTAEGTAFVAGATRSWNFPTVAPYQSAWADWNDAFVAKIATRSPAPEVCFSAIPPTPCKGQEISFDLSCSSAHDSCEWDFGDGTAPSYDESPRHIYDHSGTYKVQLNLTNAFGSSSAIQDLIVMNAGPHACFNHRQPDPSNLYEVCFDASCSEDAETFTWNLGDGEIATGKTTCHTYATLTDQAVALEVANECDTDLTTSTVILDPDSYDRREIAERFAPVLFMCRDDWYNPNDVSILMGDAALMKEEQVIWQEPPASIFDTNAYWSDDYYLDIMGISVDDPLPAFSYREKYLDNGAACDIPKLYAHVTDFNDGDGLSDSDGCVKCTVVQYWFFYYFNDWWNLHEGDWEMVQITLDREKNFLPVMAAYSQHTNLEKIFTFKNAWGTKLRWGSPNMITSGDHPWVYVAHGSHASYFRPGTYHVRFSDDDIACGSGKVIRPAALEDPTVTALNIPQYEWVEEIGLLKDYYPGWMNFEGTWGHGFSFREVLWEVKVWKDAPKGPAHSDTRFFDGLGWARERPWNDEFWDKDWSSVYLLLTGEVDMVLQDMVGRLVGRDEDGTICQEVAGSTYLEADNGLLKSITVLGVDYPAGFDVWLKSYGLSGTLDLTVVCPDLLAQEIVRALFDDVSFTPTTIGALHLEFTGGTDRTLGGVLDLTLVLDHDGDGVGDETVQPAAYNNSALDLSLPGPVEDLSAVLEAADRRSVLLSWSAPQDDAIDEGVAYYDLRYDTAPITPEGWETAKRVAGEPIPGSPGTMEHLVVTALDAGVTYYFTIRGVDEARNYSELSNQPIVQIPGDNRVYLPLIMQAVGQPKRWNRLWRRALEPEGDSAQVN